MEALRALFDTNILIDYLNGVAAAKAEIARYERPAISVISWIEVLAGTRPGVEAETRKFLSSFERIELSENIADRAVALRTRLEDARARCDHPCNGASREPDSRNA